MLLKTMHLCMLRLVAVEAVGSGSSFVDRDADVAAGVALSGI